MPKNNFFIDSCIFLAVLIKDDNTQACNSFLKRVEHDVYVGYISPFVTGEMINSILYNDKIKGSKLDLLYAIIDTLISANVKNFVPLNNQIKVYSELREADNRISESDLMHVVCAKILDIPLVTTDNTLLNSQGLKDYVEIIHPSKCY